MGFFRKSEIRADPEGNDVIGEESLSDGLLSAIMSDASITKEQALKVPTVNACISVIAQMVASIPIKLYQQRDGQTEIKKTDPRLFLLNRENGDTLTVTQFWRAMLEDYYLDKGGYAYIRKDYSMPVSMHYVQSKNVNIMHNTDHIFKTYSVTVDGNRYSDFDFFKLLRNTKNGWSSKPITEECGLCIATAFKEFTFEHSIAAKGGNKKGFLTSEHSLTDSQIAKLKRAFKRLFGTGEENMVILQRGMTFKESSNTSVEMQLNENKETNAKEIASLFHVPLSIIRGNATKDDFINFIKLAVMPVLNDIEAELNRVFLIESEKKEGYYFAFDTRVITRGSVEERYAAYKEGLDANFLQIDEVRDMEDMPPMGINFIKLGLDAVLYDPKTKTAYTPNTDALSTITKNKETADGSRMEGGEIDESGN